MDQENMDQLIRVTVTGNWRKAKKIIDNNPTWIRKIFRGGKTILHIAVEARQRRYVMKLVEKLMLVDLVAKDEDENTALSIAIINGCHSISQILIKRNPRLIELEGAEGKTPLQLAALHCSSLRRARFFKDTNKSEYFYYCVYAGLFGLATKAVSDASFASISRRTKRDAMSLLIEKAQTSFWGTSEAMDLFFLIFNQIDNWSQEDEISWMLEAAKHGNAQFFTYLHQRRPLSMFMVDESIIHVAVQHRQMKILNMTEIIPHKLRLASKVDSSTGENLLHLFAKSVPPLQPNTNDAFMLHKEILWFEEVKKMVPRFYMDLTDDEGKKPQQIFDEKHIETLKSGTKWIKTAVQHLCVISGFICGLAAACILSPPGGLNSGVPNFAKKLSYKIFFMDIIGVIFLSFSTLAVCSSVILSRKKEYEYIKSTTSALLSGLLMVFVSMMAMMAALTISLYITGYHSVRNSSIYIFVSGWGLFAYFISKQLPILFSARYLCRL